MQTINNNSTPETQVNIQNNTANINLNDKEVKIDTRSMLRHAVEGMKKAGLVSNTFIWGEILDYDVETEELGKFLTNGHLLPGENIEDFVYTLLVFQPRALYDYFDSCAENIEIYEAGGKWGNVINGMDDGKEYINRWEAEKAAFLAVLNKLGLIKGEDKKV